MTPRFCKGVSTDPKAGVVGPDKRRSESSTTLPERITEWSRLIWQRSVGAPRLVHEALSSRWPALTGAFSGPEALQAVLAAHRCGFRHFDTAPWYGNGLSEARVGVALHDVALVGGAFAVSTKVGRFLDPQPRRPGVLLDGPWAQDAGSNLRVRYYYSHDAILQHHRESCLRMSLPRVDALAIHDLDAMFMSQDAVQGHLDQLGRGGGLRALAELKRQGQVKAIGIGCNPCEFSSLEVCQAVVDMGELDYILLAGAYNLLNQEALDDLLPLCRQRHMSVIVGAPFASGILAVGTRGSSRPRHMYKPAADEVMTKCAAIEEVCDKHDVPLPAAALQFPLFHPSVASVLCGVRSAGEALQAKSAINAAIPLAFWL